MYDTATDKHIIISHDHDDDGSECIETKDIKQAWYHAYGTDIIEYETKKRWTFEFMTITPNCGVAVSCIGIIDNNHINN